MRGFLAHQIGQVSTVRFEHINPDEHTVMFDGRLEDRPIMAAIEQFAGGRKRRGKIGLGLDHDPLGK